MGGVGIVNGAKAEAFIEARGTRGDGAESDGGEVAAGLIDEGYEQGATDMLIAPVGSDIDAADAPSGGVVEVGIAVEAADGDEHAVIDAAEQDFSGAVIAILPAGELIHEGVEEVEALGTGLFVKAVNAGVGQFDSLESWHSSG